MDADADTLQQLIQDETVLDVARVTLRESGPAPPRPAASEPVERLGRHQVLGLLGQGGMGTVLRVRDGSLGREVAAKLVTSAADQLQLSKFVVEAQVTGQLEHPSIVPVYELGRSADGQLYFTMKRVQGQDLEQLIATCREGEPIPLYRRLEIFLKVCDALAFAHDKGVIHRDLKPANIMVGAFGEVLVMDWGLAKVVGAPRDLAEGGVAIRPGGEGDALRTLDGAIMGTPSYMPPEQAEGKVSELGPRSDVYSLGAILYELLTFEPPYSGGTVWEVLAAVTEGPPPPPSQRAPEQEIPWELESAVARAMAHRAEGRYDSVEALREDIQAFLDGRTLTAASYAPWQVLGKWARRHAAAVTAVALVLLVLAGAVGYGVVRSEQEKRRIAHERDLARTARAEAERSEEIAVRARDRAEAAQAQAEQARTAEREQRLVSESLLLLARAEKLLVRRRIREAGLLIGTAHERSPSPDSQAARLLLPDSVARLVAVIRGSQHYRAAWSPDGRLLAVAGSHQPCRVYRTDGTLLRELGTQTRRAAWSPRGALAVACVDDHIRVWRPGLRSTAPDQTWPRPPGNTIRLTWSPDGRWLASLASAQIDLFDAATGQHRHRIPPEAKTSPRALYWHGGRLIVGGKHRSGTGFARIIDPATGATVKRQRSDHPVLDIWLRSDGRLSAGMSPEHAFPGRPRVRSGEASGVGLYDDRRRLIEELPLSQRLWWARYAPGGRYVCVQAWGSHFSLWALRDGEPGRRRRTGGEPIRALAVGADGRQVALIHKHGALSVWELATGRRVARRQLVDGQLQGLAVAPDGSWLATGGEKGVILHRPADGPGVPLAGHDGWVLQVAAAPGSAELASCGTDHSVRLWDPATGRQRARLETGMRNPDTIFCVGYSPGGRWLAAGTKRHEVLLWPRPARGPARVLRGHTGHVKAVAFQPGGRLLASGGDDQSIRLWDTRTGASLGRLIGHGTWVQSLAFSADGQLLASGDRDGNLALWDVAGRRLIRMRTGAHPGRLGALRFIAGGRLVSACWKGTLRLWGGDAPSTADEASAASGLTLDGMQLRSLSPKEHATLRGRTSGAPPSLWTDSD